MPAPEKAFFRLDEICARWGVDHEALLDYARQDQLVFSVYRRNLGSHTTVRETQEGTVTTTVQSIQVVAPAVPPSPIKFLEADDARRVLEAGPGVSITVHKLYDTAKRNPKNGSLHVSGVSLTADEMVITKEERDRFEVQHGMVQADAQLPAALARVLIICKRFPAVVRSFRNRYNGRAKYFDVADEYDVQDLMEGLLAIDFDDVRREDAVPSRAGRNSRIDFLLHQEELGLELKMPRSGLRDKDLGEQLAVDIQRYRAHPRCRTLVCFVYDPDHTIKNPRGIERDLSGVRDGMAVHVLIAA